MIRVLTTGGRDTGYKKVTAMQHTAGMDTELGHVCEELCGLLDDYENASFPRHSIDKVGGPLRVLANIVGSVYTVSYERDVSKQEYIFRRHENTGVRRWEYTEMSNLFPLLR
jgi:hypothetical protein